MPQSRLTSKNTFKEGLVMDFAPDNSQADSLTNALNATLLTYNGNEMSLLNDMGNGRVETAFLPEGYIPMGTCEFGGIIYIASYNPQENLCQIGSFPSPERNITKNDGMDLNPPALSNINFQEIVDGEATGKIQSLVSRVILREDSLNPGDKYLVYETKPAYSLNDFASISNLGEISTKNLKLSIVSIEDSGKITKLDTKNYNINIDGSSLESSKYIIANSGINTNTGDIDIDAYRKSLLLNYNVFSAKVPGKLAILAELETIGSFSCGHKVIATTTENSHFETNSDAVAEGKEETVEVITKNITYDVYLDYSWESENPDIIPQYITITDFTWKPLNLSLGDTLNYTVVKNGKITTVNLKAVYEEKYNTTTASFTSNNYSVNLPALITVGSNGLVSHFYHTVDSGPAYDLTDSYYVGSTYENEGKNLLFKRNDTLFSLKAGIEIGEKLINNELSLSNTIKVCSITVPSTIEESNFILPYTLHYEVTPAMKFGLLENLAVQGDIDFSRVGTKTIALNGYKYYASLDLLLLNLNSEIYEELNKQVTQIFLEFYDHNGFCGSCNFKGRESYTGTLQTYIPFNIVHLNKYKYADPSKLYYHDVFGDSAKGYKSGVAIAENYGDCGVLYSNTLYGVKVIYEYSTLDPITKIPQENPELIEKGFWLYTDGQFNEAYYLVDSFEDLVPEIPLEYAATLTSDVKKSNLKLDNDSLQRLDLLTKKITEDNLYLWNQKEFNFKSTVDYTGKIAVDLKFGISQNSIFGLTPPPRDFSSRPHIEVTVKNPLDTSNNYTLIYSNSSQEDKEYLENSQNVEYVKTELLFKVESYNKSINDAYEVTPKINMELTNIPFITPASNFKLDYIKTTVLTPVVYAEDGLNFNYDDVGGDTMFSKAICYLGSDDTDHQKGETSDERWYEVSIYEGSAELDKKTYYGGLTVDSLLYEYPEGELHRSLMSGHDSLKSHYDLLGNRLPFTLFTVQIPEPDSDLDYGWSHKWTCNIAGTGYVRTDSTNDDTNYEHNYDLQSDWQYKTAFIRKQASNGVVRYSPFFVNRSYIPAFINQRIASGEGTPPVLMCSNGSPEYKFSENNSTFSISTADKDSDKNTIQYTARSYTYLKENFYNRYLTTMKWLYTVNPDYSECPLGSFEFDRNALKGIELLSVLYAQIIDSEDNFKNSASQLISINGMQFTNYIEAVVNNVGSSLTFLDKNVSVVFNTNALGKEDPVPITYILYLMPHEHSLIDDYLNLTGYVAIKFPGDYYSKTNYGSWSVKGSEKDATHLIKTSVNPQKFYLFYKENEEFKLQAMTGSFGCTESTGYIRPETVSSSYAGKATDIQYVNYGSPLFYGTTMNIEDFMWDPENKKHHFIFKKDSVLHLVRNNYSYQLNDEGHTDNNVKKVTRSYYIGPSFKPLSANSYK